MPNHQDNDFWVNRLDKIEAKQDKIIDSQTALLLKVSLNTQVLAEHQRRSLANEQLLALAKLEADRKIAEAKLEADRKIAELRIAIEPLTKVQNATTAFAKVVAFLGVAAALTYSAMKIFGFAP
jgi:hypothetical protein